MIKTHNYCTEQLIHCHILKHVHRFILFSNVSCIDCSEIQMVPNATARMLTIKTKAFVFRYLSFPFHQLIHSLFLYQAISD